MREEMGYGRQGAQQGPALKSCEGVRDAVAEWLVVPSGMERAVEAVLGSAFAAGSWMSRQSADD
ncbi:MAG: hypothetical protein U0236_14315 [Nitrospira sp.]